MNHLTNWFKSLIGRSEKGSRCLCCGKCCESFGGHLQTSRADIERWRHLGREDLLRRVNRLGWIWIDPESGRPEQKCPFLQRTGAERATCAIHDIKPDICRSYPTLAHERRCLSGAYLNWSITLCGWGSPLGLQLLDIAV